MITPWDLDGIDSARLPHWLGVLGWQEIARRPLCLSMRHSGGGVVDIPDQRAGDWGPRMAELVRDLAVTHRVPEAVVVALMRRVASRDAGATPGRIGQDGAGAGAAIGRLGAVDRVEPAMGQSGVTGAASGIPT